MKTPMTNNEIEAIQVGFKIETLRSEITKKENDILQDEIALAEVKAKLEIAKSNRDAYVKAEDAYKQALVDTGVIDNKDVEIEIRARKKGK
jgi:hypothetical protein